MIKPYDLGGARSVYRALTAPGARRIEEHGSVVSVGIALGPPHAPGNKSGNLARSPRKPVQRLYYFRVANDRSTPHALLARLRANYPCLNLNMVANAENPRPSLPVWGGSEAALEARLNLLQRLVCGHLWDICQLASIAFLKAKIDMKRSKSPTISPAMAAHIRFLVKIRGLYQHQAAALCGVNQGRVSEVIRGYRHPGVPPAQGAFPF